MAVVRLTEEQQGMAVERMELARQVSRRFKVPAGIDREEWEAECLLVLVEALGSMDRNTNFGAHLYMLCRFRRMQINARRRPLVGFCFTDVLEAKATRASQLDEVLEGVSPVDSDIIRLRMNGGRWETIGKAYGVSGRTIQRRHRAALGKLRREVMA